MTNNVGIREMEEGGLVTGLICWLGLQIPHISIRSSVWDVLDKHRDPHLTLQDLKDL